MEDNCIKKIGKKVVQLEKLKYFLLANNQLSELPFNPHQTSRGLRRLTLKGNQLDLSTLALDTDIQEAKAMAKAKSAGASNVAESKLGLPSVAAIAEGDEEDEESD